MRTIFFLSFAMIVGLFLFPLSVHAAPITITASSLMCPNPGNAAGCLHMDSNINTGGGTDDTAVIQQSLNQIGENPGGGTLEFDVNNKYSLISATTTGITSPLSNDIQTTALEMTSSTTIKFDYPTSSGVFLKAHSDCAMLGNNMQGSPSNPAMETNMTVNGGIWNGNAANQDVTEFNGANGDGMLTVGFWFSGYNGITLENLTISNSKRFSMVIGTGSNVTIQNATSTWAAPTMYQDSIHIWGPVNGMTVNGFNSNGGDDVLALVNLGTDEQYVSLNTSYLNYRFSPEVANITNAIFENVVFNSSANGIRFITHNNGSVTPTFNNIVFHNISGNITTVPMDGGGPTIGNINMPSLTFSGWKVTGQNAINVASSLNVGTLTLSDISAGTPISAVATNYSGNYYITTVVTPIYWFSSGDNNWSTISNWWTDSSHTIPAGALPTATSSVVTEGTIAPSVNLDTWVVPANINTNATGITFTSQNGIGAMNNYSLGYETLNAPSYSTETITGNATFNGNSYNGATINGNAIFNGNSYNGGTIDSNATFNDDSYNSGTVDGLSTFKYAAGGVINVPNGGAWGNGTSASNVGVDNIPINFWIFNGNSQSDLNSTMIGNAVFNDTSTNNGTVNGSAFFFGDLSTEDQGVSNANVFARVYTANATTSNDLTLNQITGTPWIVIADGAVINISGAQYDNSTVFYSLNGGKFAPTPTQGVTNLVNSSISLSVSPLAAFSITVNSATINATTTSTNSGYPLIVSRGFVWGTSQAYGATTTENGVFNFGKFSTNLTGLSCGTTYHYSAYAVNTTGVARGADSSFTTSACPVGASNGPVVGSYGLGNSVYTGSAILPSVPQIVAGLSTPAPVSVSASTSSNPSNIVRNPVMNTASSTMSILGHTNGLSVYKFTRQLHLGMVGPDVRQLQVYLNSQGLDIAKTGNGSPGHESEYFGLLTWKALVNFQNIHASDILAPVHLTSGTGLFGSSTMKYINSN